MEDLKLTIEFSNVIPFPLDKVKKQRTVYDFEKELDEIEAQAKYVEKLSEDLLRLAEEILKNPGKYE
tara:strand:- start:353 stop:553 length:201 start_codon:yes stop_codon:yes gene_type:complete